LKKILLFIVLLGVVLIWAYRVNSNISGIILKLDKKGIAENRDLKYQVNLFNIFPVADAIFYSGKQEEYKGKKVDHLSARTFTKRSFSRLFDANVALDTYIDPSSGNPLYFKQRISISGKEDSEKEIIYDQKNGAMELAGVRRSILPDTQDFLSAIYNLRKMDFAKVKAFDMNINTNQKNYMFKGEVSGKSLKVNRKNYEIFIVKGVIKRRDKNPYHKTEISIVFLKGKENIPLFIKVFSSGFLLGIKLTDIQNPG